MCISLGTWSFSFFWSHSHFSREAHFYRSIVHYSCIRKYSYWDILSWHILWKRMRWIYTILASLPLSFNGLHETPLNRVLIHEIPSERVWTERIYVVSAFHKKMKPFAIVEHRHFRSWQSLRWNWKHFEKLVAFSNNVNFFIFHSKCFASLLQLMHTKQKFSKKCCSKHSKLFSERKTK